MMMCVAKPNLFKKGKIKKIKNNQHFRAPGCYFCVEAVGRESDECFVIEDI